MTSATGRNFYGINNLQQKTVFVLIPFPHFGGSKKVSQAVNQGPLIEGNLILIFFSEAAISASNSEHQGVSNLRPVQTRCSSLHLIQWTTATQRQKNSDLSAEMQPSVNDSSRFAVQCEEAFKWQQTFMNAILCVIIINAYFTLEIDSSA